MIPRRGRELDATRCDPTFADSAELLTPAPATRTGNVGLFLGQKNTGNTVMGILR